MTLDYVSRRLGKTIVMVMREEVRGSIMRFEAMVDLCTYEDPDCPGQIESDRRQFGKEFAVPRTPEGRPMFSPAKTVRFLVGVCGYSYDESLAAVVEDMRGWPRRPAVIPPDAEAEARAIRNTAGTNVIETLFDLKVMRLAFRDEDVTQDYCRRLTRVLVSLARQGEPEDRRVT